MSKSFFYFVTSFLISALLIFPTSLLATTDLVEGVSDSCPLYNVRGVTATVATQISGLSLGSEVPFSVLIKNNNDFPVVDGSLFVRIEGVDGGIYDRFFVSLDKNAMAAKSEMSTNFVWEAPSFGTPGEYLARVYFLSSKQFYLGGVTFIDGLSTGDVAFSLVGENRSFVKFDKSSLTVNNVKYSSRGGLSVGKTEPVELNINVNHNLKEKSEAIVSWKVYKWDGITEDNLIGSSIEKIDVLPGKISKSSFAFNNNSHSSYQIIGELSWMGAQSILTARVTRQSVPDSMLRLVALSRFPVSGETNSKVFGCIDNVLTEDDANLYPKTLIIKVTGGGGRVVADAKYEIPRLPIVGFVKTIDKQKNYKQLNISVDLVSANDVLLEHVDVFYDCKDMGQGACSSRSDGLKTYIYALVLVIGLTVLFLVYRHRKRKLTDNSI